MEILTEFDELQAALAKVNMDESVLPYVNGRLVANSEAFNKTQKILNCPEMISAHKYLYNLDMDQLTEEDVGKIDQLYKLGCDRGFIIDDLTKWDDEDGEEEQEEVVAAEAPAEAQPKNTLFKAKIPCWTVIYSATKDGDIKTGEAYSNAVSINAAKADVNAKLAQCGYDNITILAIENCTDIPKASVAPAAVEQVSSIGVNEADEDDADDEDSGTSNDSEDSDDSSDDSTEDAGDEDEDDSDDSSEDSSDEGSDDEDSADDDSSSDEDDANDTGDSSDSSDETSDEDSDEDNDSSEDDSNEDSGEDEEEDSDEDSGESGDEDSSDGEDELDPNEKAELRDLYRKTFKNTLIKCKFDTSFNDLTLEQKVKFFTELSKAWKKDNEPNEFMTDKEVEQLNNVVAQKSADTGDEDAGNDESNDE